MPKSRQLLLSDIDVGDRYIYMSNLRDGIKCERIKIGDTSCLRMIDGNHWEEETNLDPNSEIALFHGGHGEFNDYQTKIRTEATA